MVLLPAYAMCGTDTAYEVLHACSAMCGTEIGHRQVNASSIRVQRLSTAAYPRAQHAYLGELSAKLRANGRKGWAEVGEVGVITVSLLSPYAYGPTRRLVQIRA